MNKSRSSPVLGCLILVALIVFIVSGAVLSFLKASWPTWGLLLLAIVFRAVTRAKKENLFFKATHKVLEPITLALGVLMGLEVLFGLFKSFFSEDRVAFVEDAILRLHFVIEDIEHSLGYLIPLAVAIAVAWLCLTVGDWKYSSALSKAKDWFSFVSVAVIVMASFTFFRESPTNELLDWERQQNQMWYQMAIANEERSVSRLVAARELKQPLVNLDDASKQNFAAFFSRLKEKCAAVSCFRGPYDVVLDFYDNPPSTVAAFEDTIRQKVNEDYLQFMGPGESFPEDEDLAELYSTHPELFKRSDHLPSIPKLKPSIVDLASSQSSQERLLSKRASSQSERLEQKRIVDEQQKRSREWEGGQKYAKERITESFATVLAASVPDAEGIIGAYVSELIDATAEWIVRPVVNQLFKQGYRPETVQDLHFATEKVPATMGKRFGGFHSEGARNPERSAFAKPEMVDEYFNRREEASIRFKKEMETMHEQAKKMDEERREREVE